jgi:hypothetical protein
MITAATTWFMLTGAIGLGSLLMWKTGRLGISKRFAILRKRLTCPTKKQEKEVGFLACAGENQQAFEVMYCSAFPGGKKVACEKACLSLAARV